MNTELAQEVRADYERITKLLIRDGLSITTMESCTGGLLASLITDTEGASGILRGAFVTYSNEAKIRAGVPEDVIERYSVYSEETAAAMAQACRRYFDAEIGVGVTGSFGNIDPANPASSVPGRVYFAVDTRRRTQCFTRTLPDTESRRESKLLIAREIAEVLFGTVSEIREESDV